MSAVRAAKLKAVQPQPVPVQVFIKKGKSTSEIISPVLADLVPRAFGLYQDMKAVEPELKKLKAAIFNELEPELDGSGTITVLVENIACKITQGWEYLIDEKDIPLLKELLGDRFVDLVTVKNYFKPEKKLVEMCFEGDTPEEIRSTVQAKEKSPVFSFSINKAGE